LYFGIGSAVLDRHNDQRARISREKTERASDSRHPIRRHGRYQRLIVSGWGDGLLFCMQKAFIYEEPTGHSCNGDGSSDRVNRRNRFGAAGYSLKVPDGLAFSEFEGYDTRQTVAVNETEGSVKAILANPAMISAYKEGVPDCENRVEQEEESSVAVFCASAGPEVACFYREGLEEISRIPTDGHMQSLNTMPSLRRSSLP
jgi:hypothetical protein